MSQARNRNIRSDERAYMIARGVAVALMFGIGVLRLPQFAHSLDREYFFVALAGFTVVGIVQAYAYWARQMRLSTVMVAALPIDLVLIGLFTAALTETGDLGFALAMAWPVLYALVFRRREVLLIAGLLAAVYAFGNWSEIAFGHASVSEILIKAAVIVLVGGRVAYSEQRQQEREDALELAGQENERLNAELHASLTELQALFEVTGYVHASLDFDLVASPVLRTIARALGIARCALCVVDTSTNCPIASATLGIPMDVALPFDPDADYDAPADSALLDAGYACFSPFDEAHLRFVLCMSADDLAVLSENDHLLLQAIGREVAVAVDNSVLYKLTKRMAVTDELTGLHNYRFLQQRMAEEVERALRYSGYVSLLMLDADDFKAFNDAYGHPAGDQVLAELGEVLEANVRACDLVARYGGEEFSVLLPETDMMGAVAAAEKLRDAVAQHSFQQPYGRRLSVSIGLATYPTHGIDSESVLCAADTALYSAKGSGKNQVHMPDVYDGRMV